MTQQTLDSHSPSNQTGKTVVTAQESELAAASGPPPCPQCGSDEPWGYASWCPNCGYYPALNMKGDAPPVWTDAAEGPSNLWEAIPGWAWVLAAGLVGITGLSVWASFMLGEAGGPRLLWTLSQSLIGFLLFSITQIAVYLFAAQGTDKFGPFDFFMKPIEIWKPTFARLPDSSHWVCMAAWGVWGIVAAFLFIGGVSISAIFEGDWGFEERAKHNLVHELVQKAREQEAEEGRSLEEAMNEFVGEEAEEEKKKEIVRNLSTECVIFGYTPEKAGDGFVSVTLATIIKGRVVHVGDLWAHEIPQQDRDKIAARLPSLITVKPFTKVPFKATWVRPKLMCRVKHSEWTADKKLKDAVFDGMLADLDAK